MPPSGPSSPPSRRALPPRARWTLVVMAALLALPLLLVGLLQTSGGVRWAAQTGLDLARPLPGARLMVGGARGGILTGVELIDLSLVSAPGIRHAHIDTLRITYLPAELFGRSPRVRSVHIAGLSLWTTPGLDSLRAWFARRPPHKVDPDFALDLNQLEVTRAAVRIVPGDTSRAMTAGASFAGARLADGLVRLEGLRVRGADVSLATSSLHALLFAPRDSAALATLSVNAAMDPGRIRDLHIALDGDSTHLALSGSIELPSSGRHASGQSELLLQAAPLAGSDLRRLIPKLARASDLTLEARLTAADDSITFSGHAQSTAGGRLDASGLAIMAAERVAALRLQAKASGVDANSWSTLDPGALVINGDLDLDLNGPDAAHLSGPLVLSIDATGTMAASHPIHAQAAARFTDGATSLRADATVDQFALHVAGTARPFGVSAACDLDLAADVPSVNPSWRRAGPHVRPLMAGRLIGTVRAQRDSSGTAAGQAEFTFDPDELQHGELGPGRFEATLAAHSIHWQTRLAIESGSLEAHGDLIAAESPRYTVAFAEARALPIGALLGDSLASTLDATLTLEGRGLSLASANVAGLVTPLVFSRGAIVARLDTLNFVLHDNRLEAHTRGEVDGTALNGRGWLRPVVPQVRAAGLAIRFEHLDGSRFFRDTLLASRLDGALEGSLTAPDLAAWRAPEALSAARAAEAGGTLHLELEPSEWRHDRVRSLTINAALAAGQVHYDGRLESSFGSARWSGDARPFGPAPQVRLSSLTLEDLDLSRLLAAPMPRTRLGGAVTAELSGSRADSLDARWGVSLDGSSLGGSRWRRLRLRGSLVRGALEGGFEGDEGPDSVQAQLTGHVLSASNSRGWNASGRFHAGARFGGAGLDTVNGEFALEDNVLRVPRLEVAGSLIALSAHGCVALGPGAISDSTDLTVRGIARDLEPLGRRLGISPLDVGAGAFELRATGPRDAVILSGTLTATRLKVNHSRADSLHVSLHALARTDSIADAGAQVIVRGLVPEGATERDVEAALSWDGHALGVDAHAQLVVGGTQDIALRLERGDGMARVSLDRFDMNRPPTHVQLEQPAVIEIGHDALSVDHFTLVQDGQRSMTVSGAVRDDSSSVLTVSLDSLDIAPPLVWFGVGGLKGRVSAQVELRGPRRAPAVDGWLRGTIATERGRWAHLAGDLAWRGDSLGAGLRFAQNDRQWIDIRMRVPVGLDLDLQPGERMVHASEGDFTETLEARQFDFAWFQPLISERWVRKLAGRMDGSVHASGSTVLPDFSGELRVRRARVQIPPLATTFQSKDVALTFDKRSIVLGPAVVTAGSGRVELKGTATFEGPGHRTFASSAAFSKFRFMNTALAKVELDGDLHAEGPIGRPAVTGTLEMANSTLYAESGGQSDRKLEAVELTEADWRQLDARFSEADLAAPTPFAGLSDSIQCDVRVKIGRNVWVRRRSDPIVALEMSGQVHATRERGEPPQLAGRIEVQTGRSYLSFLNRRFDLTRARVELPGPIPDASAELEAQYLPGAGGTGGSSAADGPEVTALVTLGAEGARVDLHSTPFMEHAALINYLATGQTQGEMSSGTAYGLAVGSVLGTVGGSAGRSLGLDVVQVTQDAYGGQTLSAGSHVKPQLYLGFRQPVVQGTQSSSRGESGTYTTEFEVEVEAGKRMLMNVQGGGSQYRFLLRPRLGK